MLFILTGGDGNRCYYGRKLRVLVECRLQFIPQYFWEFGKEIVIEIGFTFFAEFVNFWRATHRAHLLQERLAIKGWNKFRLYLDANALHKRLAVTNACVEKSKSRVFSCC